MQTRQFLVSLAAVIITATTLAQNVTLRLIGRESMMSGVHAEYLEGKLYSIDYRGALYKTDLLTGKHSRVGKGIFTKPVFFFAYQRMLYVMEWDGSLQQVDTSNGTWTTVSSIGSWVRIRRLTVVNDTLYAFENGSLYQYHSLDPKDRILIGKNDFYYLDLLMRTDSTLYSMENGRLFKVDLRNGTKTRIGKSDEWKYARTAAICNNKLYTVEIPDDLFESDLKDGIRKQIGNNQFGRVRYLFSHIEKLFMVSTTGSLYEIVIN